MRYLNKKNLTEALANIHFDPKKIPAHIVGLTENNPFWQPIPDGMQLQFDTDGLPIGLEVIPPPSLDELATIERAWRDSQLRATDLLMLPDRPLTSAQRDAISQYRAALRIGPNTHADFPDQTWRPEWPEGWPRT